MTQPDVRKGRPVGYWIKRLDELITRESDRALSDMGFTRTRWQVLNSVYEAGTVSPARVLEGLQPFLDKAQLEEIADNFAARGWLDVQDKGDSAQWTLTQEGRRVRDEVFGRQGEVRRLVAQGISEQEYLTTIDVLRRMVGNLEAAGAGRE